MDFEGLCEFGDDVAVVSGFDALVGGDCVAVHWVAGENNGVGVAGAVDRLNMFGQYSLNLNKLSTNSQTSGGPGKRGGLYIFIPVS
jgi:hypothetical protein